MPTVTRIPVYLLEDKLQPTLQQLQIITGDEEFIICEILLKRGCFGVVSALLSGENFLIPRHREIYLTAKRLLFNDIEVDLVSVYREGDSELIGEAFDLAMIVTRQNEMRCALLDLDVELEPIEAYCDRVRQYSAVFTSVNRVTWSAPKPRKMTDKEVNEYLYGGE